MKAGSLVLLGSFLALSLVSCSESTGPSNGDDTGNGNGGPDPIASGSWSAQADFGTFTLTVNSGGTAVTNISYSFSDFSCGGVTINGGLGVTSSWSITNRVFTITNDMNPDPFGSARPLTVTGTFADSGRQVSGTWSATWSGDTCGGSWQGSAG